MIVYDDKDDNETSQKSIPQSSCKADEYEITVRMSDKFFSLNRAIGSNYYLQLVFYFHPFRQSAKFQYLSSS